MKTANQLKTRRLLPALLAAALPAACLGQSQVQVYGVVDTGFGYMKSKGQSGRVEAVNGGQAASLWGIKGAEDLGGGGYVKFILEQGFKPSTGAQQTSNVLFDRDSLLIIGGNWGELGFGRSGGLMGTTGYFGQFPRMGANPMQANFIDTALIGSLVNSGMLNNSVTYQASPFQNVTVALQYSNGVSSDEEKWSKNDHFYGASVNFKTKSTSLGAIFTVTQYRASSTYAGPDSKAAKNLFLTANHDFSGLRLYASYQHVWDSRQLGGGPNAFYAKDLGFGTAAQVKGSRSGFRSDTFVIGANRRVGTGKINAAFKWNFAKWEGDSFRAGADRKGNRWVASLKYTYPLSKRTMLYAIGNYAKGSGMFEEAKAKATRITSAFGLSHRF